MIRVIRGEFTREERGHFEGEDWIVDEILGTDFDTHEVEYHDESEA
jgi:hypothetical protein